MLEKEIESKVCKYAMEKGWLQFKFNSMAHRSVPDRIMISPKGQVVFIEFKKLGKKPTSGQMREASRLLSHRQIVLVIDKVEDGIKIIDNLE